MKHFKLLNQTGQHLHYTTLPLMITFSNFLYVMWSQVFVWLLYITHTFTTSFLNQLAALSLSLSHDWICSFLFPLAARQRVCPLRCRPSCHRARPAATHQSAAAAAPARLWPSLSGSTRWLPATSRSPPTSCSPLRSGTRLSSYPRSRRVNYWNALNIVSKTVSESLQPFSLCSELIAEASCYTCI